MSSSKDRRDARNEDCYDVVENADDSVESLNVAEESYSTGKFRTGKRRLLYVEIFVQLKILFVHGDKK